MTGEGDWRDSALCAQIDPEAWFPAKGQSNMDAKQTCGNCEVRTECLEYALVHDIEYGVWGGMSEAERRKLRGAERAAA